MSNEKNDGGSAFPAQVMVWSTEKDAWLTVPYNREQGLTIRQYAAIHLQQPDSGIDWLDDMIRKAKRDAIAEKAMQAIISTDNLRLSVYESAKARECNPDIVMAECAYSYVDAMIKEGGKK